MTNPLVQSRPRIREHGIGIGKLDPGPFNAITDVAGVQVGHSTIIEGAGELTVGKGPARTGVTAILPHERNPVFEPVEAAQVALNGAGTTMGLSHIDEYGQIEAPVMLTNTYSVGAVFDAVTRYLVRRIYDEGKKPFWFAPVVGETYDGVINDIAGLHVKEEHVVEAIESAASGPVAEGSVGAGTGISLFGFKGGMGTASRVVDIEGQSYTVGAIIQGNFSGRFGLMVDGVRVGELLEAEGFPSGLRRLEGSEFVAGPPAEIAREVDGSVMVVLATDAPIDARKLKRMAKRATIGVVRTGSNLGHGSGDYFIAFSTTYRADIAAGKTERLNPFVANESCIDHLFAATAEAVEEAILNAVFVADTMTGRDSHTWPGLPLDRVLPILKDHGKIRSGQFGHG